MKWWERPEIVDYIIDCYEGTDGSKRQFMWEEPNGDIVIGNSRAFTDHLSQKFKLEIANTSWSGTHMALRSLGEKVHPYSPRVNKHGAKFHNQLPEVRVVKRAE